MKTNIFLIVFGAAMVSTAFVLPASWVAFPVWLGAIGVVNGVFGLCYQRFTTKEIRMRKPTPLPFEAAPKCPKCRHYIASANVQYIAKNDVLRLKCGDKCKYKFTMRPFDHKDRVRY